MNASSGEWPRGNRVSRPSRLLRRAVLAAVSALGLLAAVAVPQQAQAAQGSPAVLTSPGVQRSHAKPAAAPAAAAPAGAARGAGAPSGSDASCPPANSASAHSASVSVPAEVRAIGGDGSATVLWCPPATGAGSVVSYTVTSSGGQTVTAKVPNDWAIVDGLTDGTSYTFTVSATTSGGASGPSASSPSVTPAKIAPPSDVLRGQPQQVTYDQSSLIIGGKRVFVTAGEFDPWRTPSPSLWLDDLQKMKADGYNAVTVYFDWDYSSPSPGGYDFSGVRDMNQFLNMAQQAGLYVIARPGPYINAETDGGGIPSWVLTSPNGYRTTHSRTCPRPCSGTRRSTRLSRRTRSPRAAT